MLSRLLLTPRRPHHSAAQLIDGLLSATRFLTNGSFSLLRSSFPVPFQIPPSMTRSEDSRTVCRLPHGFCCFPSTSFLLPYGQHKVFWDTISFCDSCGLCSQNAVTSFGPDIRLPSRRTIDSMVATRIMSSCRVRS